MSLNKVEIVLSELNKIVSEYEPDLVFNYTITNNVYKLFIYHNMGNSHIGSSFSIIGLIDIMNEQIKWYRDKVELKNNNTQSVELTSAVYDIIDKNKKRMYVLVRKDLSFVNQAVQAGHAVAEYMRHYPDTEWINGTLIYLSVDDIKQLEWYEEYLVSRRINSVTFEETDCGDKPVKTAMACVAMRDEFNLLRTVKMPKGSKLYQWYRIMRYKVLKACDFFNVMNIMKYMT